MAPDLGLSGIAVFDPLPAVSLFSGCGPLHPQIQHMDPAFKGEVQRTRKVGFHFPRCRLFLSTLGFFFFFLLQLSSSCTALRIPSHTTGFRPHLFILPPPYGVIPLHLVSVFAERDDPRAGLCWSVSQRHIIRYFAKSRLLFPSVKPTPEKLNHFK